jgi:signal transduction histidine kinase
MQAAALLAHFESKKFSEVVDAVDAASLSLRKRQLDDDEVGEINARIVALASHPKWEVRCAVAGALRYVRHDDAERAIETLVADANGHVARAAEATSEGRAERAQLDSFPVAFDARMQRLLKELEAKHTTKARTAAIRVGLAYTEFMIRATHHQAVAAMTPLSAFLETIEVFLDQGRVDEVRACVRDARSQLQQVNRVLSNARDFVKREVPEFRRTKIAAVVQRALATVSMLPIARANGLDANISVDEAMVVEAAESLLEEALVNVMKNAVEASAERRPIPIHVKVVRVKGEVEISVRDEGCGISESDTARDIWRPYGSSKVGGTGLGLPLVKKIIQYEHGGRVAVASKRGEGTTITLVLPAQQEF